MQSCLHNRKSQWLKNTVWYHYVEQRQHSIKLMHIAASVKETRAVCKSLHSTTHWKQEELKLSTAIRYIFYKHSHSSQSYSCVAKRNSSVMFITTFKPILNEKIGIILAIIGSLFMLFIPIFILLYLLMILIFICQSPVLMFFRQLLTLNYVKLTTGWEPTSFFLTTIKLILCY